MTQSRASEQPASARHDITIILDRSGSMAHRREEVIRSYNDLLAEQRTVPGKARLTLVRFDHEYEADPTVRLADAEDLSPETYEPRGSTALLDAVGRTITATEARLRRRARKRSDQGKAPDETKVLVVVMTDGMENASTDHTLEDVRREIGRLEQEAGWSFVFLGAGLDAFAQARGLGMNADRSARVGASGAAWSRGMGVVSAKMRIVRELQADACAEARREALEFTEEERRRLDD